MLVSSSVSSKASNSHEQRAWEAGAALACVDATPTSGRGHATGGADRVALACVDNAPTDGRGATQDGRGHRLGEQRKGRATTGRTNSLDEQRTRPSKVSSSNRGNK